MRTFRTLLFLLATLTLLSVSACARHKSGGAGEGDGMNEGDISLSDQQRFGGGNIPLASDKSPFDDVHFDFNSSEVSSEYRGKIQEYAKVLSGDPTLVVEVEGHCDRRGTSEYNMALGDQRAKSVASLLISFGVANGRVSTVSYGEEVPLDPGDNEQAWAKNRRAHFVVYRKN